MRGILGGQYGDVRGVHNVALRNRIRGVLWRYYGDI